MTLEKLLKVIDLTIQIDKPTFIKKAKALFRFVKIGFDMGDIILMGLIFVRIETEDKYAILDCCGFSETYGLIRTREEAEQRILNDILSDKDLVEDEFGEFWAKTKFEEIRWMDKRIDMNRFFSVMDDLLIGLQKNSPECVENAWISFDPIKEDSKVGNSPIQLHVEYRKSFDLDWNNHWLKDDEKDPDLAFCSWAENIIKQEDYSRIWDNIDIEKEGWK